jgi:hypothetical protein
MGTSDVQLNDRLMLARRMLTNVEELKFSLQHTRDARRTANDNETLGFSDNDVR